MTALTRSERSAAVRRQWDAFVAALPKLIPAHNGKWAVWLDGLKNTFSSEHDALMWASTNMGLALPFVIARVEPPRIIDLRRWPVG